MRDKNNWAEANKNRDYWGTKNYSPDMDFTHCMQSEPTDKFGTPKEIYNAICYYDVYLDSKFCRFPIIQNSIQLLTIIQKGMTDEEFEKSFLDKKLDDHNGMRKAGTPLQIANLVHHYLDWLRATSKRPWETRGLNPSRQMLDACVKGMVVNQSNELHYDEDPERR